MSLLCQDLEGDITNVFAFQASWRLTARTFSVGNNAGFSSEMLNLCLHPGKLFSRMAACKVRYLSYEVLKYLMR